MPYSKQDLEVLFSPWAVQYDLLTALQALLLIQPRIALFARCNAKLVDGFNSATSPHSKRDHDHLTQHF